MAANNALAQLRVRFPDGSEQVVPIAQSPFNIGRAPGSDLQLAHQLVSRTHARLIFQGDEVVLIDLNSANGTMVGEKRIAGMEPYALHYGESWSIGPYTLQLEPAPAGGAMAAEPAPEPLPEEPSRQPEAEEPRPRAKPKARAEAAVPPPTEPPPPIGPHSGDPAYESAMGLPQDQSRYLQYLPPIYAADPFLGRFLLAFEGILAPIEQIVDHFDLFLDPQQAPSFFLPELAAWLGLTLDEKWPIEKQRAVVAQAAEIYRRRGTRWALSRHIEIYAGVAPEIVEPDDQPFHFRVILRLPSGQSVDRTTVERIILANKPAHTTFSLEITTA